MQDNSLLLSRRSLLRSAGWLGAGLAGSALGPARLLAQPSAEEMYPSLTNLVYDYIASGRLPGALVVLHYVFEKFWRAPQAPAAPTDETPPFTVEGL